MQRVSLVELLNLAREVVSCRRLTAQWFQLSLAYLRVRRLEYPCELRLRTGDVLVLHELTDVVIFWMVFLRQHYPVTASDETIVDIGANIGVFTLYAARTAPSATIIAVEPFPDTCERLNETIRANHLENRVLVVRCAITASQGTAFMDDSANVPSQYRSVLSEVPRMLNENHKQHSQPVKGVPVPTSTLAEFLAKQHLDHLDLLKMNIHGNEYEVLLSSGPAALQRFRRIALQYHEVPARFGLGKKDLFGQLVKAGFQLVVDADTRRGAGRAILALASPQPA